MHLRRDGMYNNHIISNCAHCANESILKIGK